MIAPKIPDNEDLRQKAVEKYKLLDTLPEENYDNITALMSYVCDTPISLITLLDHDRNFLKSHHGIPFNESPRAISFCGHAINEEDPITIIEDAREDIRFHDNPLVSEHNAIFYAGVPLVDPEGFKLGTLCVYDIKPRQLSLDQKKALTAMAKQVISLFEERYQKVKLERLTENLTQRNKDLEKFAGIVSHDLKSPLSQINLLAAMLEEEHKNRLDEDGLLYLETIKTSSNTLSDYIDGMLKFYKTDGIDKENRVAIDVTSYTQEIQNLFKADDTVSIKFSSEINTLLTNKTALTQILVNLISNAIKYNDKIHSTIDISIQETLATYKIRVQDNGSGIPENELPNIFDLFETVHENDKHGNKGTGIGLATVKKVIDDLGGTIDVVSREGEGTSFTFTIER